MILTPDQLQEILDILDKQFAFFIGKNLGPEYLSTKEIEHLEGMGIDYTSLYLQASDPVYLNFQLGMMSAALGDQKVRFLHYNDFKKMLVQGKHIPLSVKEQKTLDSVKYQSLADIQSFKGKIFSDINGTVAKENIEQPEAYQEVIRDVIKEGLADRVSIQKIISNLGHKTGDWSRDFSKIVEYISHSALNEGRASILARKESKAYFIVQPGACKHCNKHYLTGGEGSEPKLFTIDELKANGSNIKKKVNEWKATIHSLHPYCRCLLTEYVEGYVWSDKKGLFIAPDNYESSIKRKKIKVQIAGKTHYV